MPIVIDRDAADSVDARRLFAELWTEVDRIYGNEAPSGVELTGMEVSRAVFVVARNAEGQSAAEQFAHSQARSRK